MNHYLFILDIHRIFLCHFKVLPPRVAPCFVRDHRCFCLWNFLSFLRTFDCRGIFKTVKVSEKNYLIRRSQYARILASKC